MYIYMCVCVCACACTYIYVCVCACVCVHAAFTPTDLVCVVALQDDAFLPLVHCIGILAQEDIADQQRAAVHERLQARQ
jgi:hypothetical protein